jgi:3-oxoacyl-[acyl-carrier-protein] synthase-3
MAIIIRSTGSAVPAGRVSNAELASRLKGQVETSDEWIVSHTGIRNRHEADEGTATSDLAAEAGRKALEAAGLEAGELSLVIVATATPDYLGCPSTACLVANALEAGNAAAFDLTAGCTGFVYGLETAASMLAYRKKRRYALLIGAETLTRFCDWTDRSTCVLFGDAAGAAVLEKTDDAPRGCATRGRASRGLLRTILGADGSQAGALYFEGGGSRKPFKAGEALEKPSHIRMNGRAVYKFAVGVITDTVSRLLEAAALEDGIGPQDLAWIVPHQANARIIQAAAKRLGFPEDKFFMNMDEYANTSAASIPLALDQMSRSGLLKQGDLVLTVGFGGGLTYGGNLICW